MLTSSVTKHAGSARIATARPLQRGYWDQANRQTARSIQGKTITNKNKNIKAGTSVPGLSDQPGKDAKHLSNADAQPTKPLFYGWIIVAVSGLLGFLGTGFFSYSRGILLPSLAEALTNGERFQISMSFSAAAITGAVLAPFIGRYVDGKSARQVILVGILIVSASYALLSLIDSILGFAILVSLGLGAGMACIGGMAWHRTVIRWFDHWRGRAIAIAVLGSSLAGVVMPHFTNWLLEQYDWQVTFMTYAGITLVVLFPIVYLFMRDQPEDVGEVRDGRAYTAAHADEMVEIKEEQKIWKQSALFRTPAFWAIGFVFGAMFCVFTAMMLHLFSHFLDIGFSRTAATTLMSITAGFAAFGKPVVGWMSDYIGARITIWVALVCQAAALLLFTMVDDFASAALAATLYGFGYSGMAPLRSFAISTSFGAPSFASVAGVVRFTELPFMLAASPLAGYIHDVTGSYQLAFTILAALMLVACAGPLFIRTGGALSRRKLIAERRSS